MARRKAKRRTRRRSSFSLINALEAYTYATIMTEGITGASPVGFFLGEGDLMESSVTDVGLGTTSMAVTGQGEISLSDIIQQPGLALPVMSSNLQSNMLPMAIAGFTTAATFRIGKRLLRKQINSVNRNIVKPVLGAGVKL